MKKYQYFLGLTVISLASLTAASVFAQEVKPLPTASHSDVITGPSADDPYEPIYVLKKGPKKGQKVDVSFRRGVQILSTDAEKQTITVANFMHHDEFNIAEIPLDGVEKMIFQIDWFNSAVPAAHTELRIRFKENMPILVKPQLKSKKNQAPVAIREMVLSIEAVKGKSTAMAFIAGFGRNYAIAYRMLSLADKREDLVDTVHEKVSQYELNLTPEQQKAILTNAIKTSDEKGVHTFYNTWENNCTTELIRIFDHSIKFPFWRKIIKPATVMGSHYPIWIRSSLRSRGILGKQIPDFDKDPSEDLTDYPVDPATVADNEFLK